METILSSANIAHGGNCPRCGGNEYRKDADGWRCQYCDSFYPNDGNPDNPAPKIPVPIYIEKRNEQRTLAHTTIAVNLAPWAVVLLCLFFIIPALGPNGHSNDAISGLAFMIVALPFGIRGIPKILAAREMLRDIDASVRGDSKTGSTKK